jgi:hypothetical protein
MATVMVVHHANVSQNRSYQAILDIIQQLNLPDDQQHTVLETIKAFRTTLDEHHAALKTARKQIVHYLATHGPVDRSQVYRLTEALNEAEIEKNEAFQTHFLDLRNQLGNQKGAQYFALLIAHLEAKGPNHHP